MLSESFQSVIASLKKAPRDFSTIHTQLEQLHQEELTALYTWIVLSGETSSLNCFKELFKKGDKQNSLVIFLTLIILIELAKKQVKVALIVFA